MRCFKILAAVAATVLAGGIASAEDQAKAPKEKKICKIVEAAVGRIPAKRICRTKAEWAGQTETAKRVSRGGAESGGHSH